MLALKVEVWPQEEFWEPLVLFCVAAAASKEPQQRGKDQFEASCQAAGQWTGKSAASSAISNYFLSKDEKVGHTIFHTSLDTFFDAFSLL